MSGDYTSDLDVASTATMSIANTQQQSSTSWLRRASTNPTTDVNLSLPIGNDINGSLSNSSEVIVDTVQPSVVKVFSSTPNGT